MLRPLLFLLAVIGLCPQGFSATTTISDSIDIKHITLDLDITDYAGQTISGSATLRIQAKVDGIIELPLDLLIYGVDSVKDQSGTHLIYSHSDELLLINLPTVLNTGDSSDITVYYAGEPAQDGSWGGWYWNGDYSYQLGVGFDAIPHNYGRAWFPCFDNFVERSTYSFHITTTDNKKAFCGGLLIDSIDNGDGTITWHWECAQTIPSYLSSVAVSTYATVQDVFPGVERDIPIQLAAKPEDTIDIKNSFINLHGAMEAFESHYGPYSWDRVGFTVVPFNAGAMEHSMNIAYPLFAVNGTLTWETLYAHELSHQWWGDLVTTRDAKEMWLNEGWAVFSEHLFTEAIYGYEAYQDAVQANHLDVINFAAAKDGNNYFPISDVPETFTYGATTYNKGAAVIHTLRGYIGDDLFFPCLTSFLEENIFTDITAAELRDHLTACSGKDMTDFFEDWVYQPGSLAFEVDNVGIVDASPYAICIQQKGNHVEHLGNNVPLTIYNVGYNGEIYDSLNVMMSGDKMMFDWNHAGLGPYYIIDYRNKLNDAVTHDEVFISGAGDYDMDNAKIDLEVTSITGEGYLYAEHYWVGADGFKSPHPGLHVNTHRYWRINGFLPAGTTVEARMNYSGQLVIGSGYLDHEFISNDEDSLVLLYRTGTDDDWDIYGHYTLNTFGSTADKRGTFELSKLDIGEYAIGIYDASIPDMPLDTNSMCLDMGAINLATDDVLKVFPNPADASLQVQTGAGMLDHTLFLVDSTGRRIWSARITQSAITIPTQNLPAGTYQLYVENARSERIAAEKVLIMH